MAADSQLCIVRTHEKASAYMRKAGVSFWQRSPLTDITIEGMKLVRKAAEDDHGPSRPACAARQWLPSTVTNAVTMSA